MRSRCVGIHAVPTELDEPVVVVDVLRAFTTAAWIVEGGASELVLASSHDDALAEKARLGAGAIAVTDGELGEGFELGNSPAQVRRFPLARPLSHRGLRNVHHLLPRCPRRCKLQQDRALGPPQ